MTAPRPPDPQPSTALPATPGSYNAAAGWLAIAIVGQTAALLLIEAGPFVRYQHYLPPSELARAGLPSAIVLAQAVAVGVGAAARLGPAWRWARTRLGWPRLAALGGVLFLTSAALSRDPGTLAVELGVAFGVQLVNLLNIALVAAAVPADRVAALGRRLDRLLGRRGDRLGDRASRGDSEMGGPREGAPAAGRERPRVDRFAALAAIWVVVVAAALSTFSYERHPHVPDEVSYLLHARYFADGRLEMPAPPVPEAFDLDLMTYEADRWYSPVPPGWPAFLAIGSLAGAPWLVNPVLAGIGILLAYLLVWELYSRRTARLCLLLLAASPWYLFLGMSLMSHMSSLACALGAGVCAARSRRAGGSSGRIGWAVAAGGLAGVVGLIRPLEAVLVGSLVGLWLLYDPADRRPLLPRPRGLGRAVAFGIGALAVGSVILPYNRHFTGSATTFPLMAYAEGLYGPGTNSLGFGPERGLGWTGLDPYPGHGLRDVVVNTHLNTFAVNTELFGWGTGSLWLVAALVLLWRVRGADRLMLAAAGAVVGLHALYWFSGGPDFGARYWFLAILPLAALTASAVERLPESREARTRLTLAVLSLSALALICFVPWRAGDKYHRYRGMRPGVESAAPESGFGRGLVLVRGRRHPDYASAAALNPVDPRADAPVFAWDRDPEVRRRVVEAYPDRRVFLVDGPTVTGDGYRLIAGPLEADAVLAR